MRSASAIAALAIAGIAAGCSGRGAAKVAPPPPETGRFPHAAHALPCAECHDPRAVAAGTPRPPGDDEHAPCDRGQCHEQAFLTTPGPLCAVCHAWVDPVGGAGPAAAPATSSLVPYPRQDAWQALPARFSHARHLDFTRMEAAAGFHVDCVDCHPPGDGAWPESPGHAACGRCHADEAGLAGAPPLSACDGCHLPGRALRHRRQLIAGDLRFDHQIHQTDLRGARVRCETCHDRSRAAAGRDDHAPPAIAACVTCHDDERQVSPQRSMRACEACHATRRENLGTLAPRSHLPATERPANHTLAFRRDHAEIAAHDAERCAACHTQLSGSPRSACDECHQTTRPVDHTVLFRELDHGAASAGEPERCATCHVADFCTACHSRPPRSHFPLAMWATEHGDVARNELRACVVCHDPVDKCGRCHDGAGGLR